VANCHQQPHHLPWTIVCDLQVKALVRRRDTKGRKEAEAAAPLLPAAVEVIEGDVGDMVACQQAVRGVSKVGGCWVYTCCAACCAAQVGGP
jgi:hypothetical protein